MLKCHYFKYANGQRGAYEAALHPTIGAPASVPTLEKDIQNATMQRKGSE